MSIYSTYILPDMESTINGLMAKLQQLYYGENWLDESYEKKLESVNEENAFVQPLGYIHSVAELVSHIVEWRKELMDRIESGRPAHLRMDSENNWKSNQVLKENGWAPLKQALIDSQERMISFLEHQSDDLLNTIVYDKVTVGWLIQGWIEHDAYHLGQIGLVQKINKKDATPFSAEQR